MPSLSGLTQSAVYIGNTRRAVRERRLLRRHVRGDQGGHANGALRDLSLEGRGARTATRGRIGRTPPRRRQGARAGGWRWRQEDGPRRRAPAHRCRMQIRTAPSEALDATSACSTSATIASSSCSMAASPWCGGHCIVDTGSADARTESTCAILACGFAGPSCTRCRPRSAENWVEDTGELFVGERRFPGVAAAGRNGRPRRQPETGRLGACGEGPASPGGVRGARTHPHPEPVFSARRRSDRSARTGRRTRRRCARDGAVSRRVGHADRAARRPPQLPQDARARRAHLRVPNVPAASEGHDGGRRVVRDRFEQLRRPLVRDQR